MKTENHGFLWIDKPVGPTSHDVVQTVRRALRTRSVGHCGTLDPAATGLLVVAVGKATKLARFVEAQDKAYEAIVRLGRATTTEDGEGETTEVAPVDLGTEPLAQVRAQAAKLVGDIAQTVPAYSAVKVGGERLYAKARRGGGPVERPTRTVHVHRLKVVAMDGADVRIECTVSKGTYIRTLGVQLGARLGVPAHVPWLRRTRVGTAQVSRAIPPLSVGPEHLRPVLDVFSEASSLCVTDAQAFEIVHGRRLPMASIPSTLHAGGPFALVHPAHGLLAVAQVEPREGGGEALRYLRVLAGPEVLSS